MTKLWKTAKWTSIILAAILSLAGLLVMDRYGAAQRSVDTHEGSLALAGIKEPVDIVRDENGIPHLFGRSEEDVSFALGVAHAQDRLWQMELFRRVGQGRLAEILGRPALPADRYLRTLGLYRLAEDTFPHLGTDTQAMLQSYANGVNAYLDKRTHPLPPEFLFLAHTPEPWVPADSIVMIKLLALGLSGNATRELSRARLLEVLNEVQLTEFEPPYPGEAPVALPDFATLFGETPIRAAEAHIPDFGPKGASNNWVVDGSWTESGKPLLANDPHLGMLAPSIWYLAHLAYPDRNVVGGTIAGVPSVVLGRNDNIAWGYTNTGPDTQDLFIEKLNPDDDTQYLTPDGYTPFETRTETIKVRFGTDETMTIRSSRHGPVLPADTFGAGDLTPGGHVLALAWTALTAPDHTIEAGHNITRARNFSDFRAALKPYIAPMQNMVFASTDGEIGFIAPARVPVRGENHDTMGLLPAPGWETRNDWQGYIPFDGLPQTHNPARGFVITANNKIVDEGYPYTITKQWDLPDRATRIEALLTATRTHTVESFEMMLMDNGSQIAQSFIPLLLPHIDDEETRSALSQWDRRMDGPRTEPLIFIAWMRELAREIYEDELGAQFSRHWRINPIFLEAVLTDKNNQARWCDDGHTEQVETCAVQITDAFAAALSDLETRYGTDRSLWRWDAAHPVTNRHLPGSFLPLIGDTLTIRRPSAGGNDTINRGQHVISSEQPYDNVHAAGYRAVYDFSDLDNSRYMISTGQSGNPFSVHYDAFADKWAEGETIKITTDRAQITGKATLHLVPANERAN
ncbi:MAG: penicillin acylase family protein [Alphaproteobacteria bacterium]|nr:penicillin acylase family protein [Alphaproteobacteria bacterium]MBO6628983.1 penicillin acylase family protein [Alphaproteobacteria bacterium]MDF1624814.1 penicillin acylase family protein [Parvibaculaceae bacterium]